ncbi:MAG: EamA family transporter, partial [Trueperella pyogenes]|nr:EamA family transporter [Trueperella pyogenes]
PSLWQLVGLVCISIAVGIASMAGRAHPDVKGVPGAEETEN